MTRPFEQLAAALVAVLLTTTSFVSVVTVPQAPASHLVATPLLA
jgi:hypothetical protein